MYCHGTEPLKPVHAKDDIICCKRKDLEIRLKAISPVNQRACGITVSQHNVPLMPPELSQYWVVDKNQTIVQLANS